MLYESSTVSSIGVSVGDSLERISESDDGKEQDEQEVPDIVDNLHDHSDKGRSSFEDSEVVEELKPDHESSDGLDTNLKL